MKLNDTTVVTSECLVIWDGLTKPEPVKGRDGKPDSQKFNIKVAVHPNHPEVAELRALIDEEVRKKYPNGPGRNFRHTLGPIGADEIPEIAGWLVFTATTYGALPPILDANGQDVPPQRHAECLYAGSAVRLMVSARTYDTDGNQGSSFWLSGVQILDATRPRLSVAAGMSRDQVRTGFGAVAGAPGVPVNAAPMAPAPAAAPTATYAPPPAPAAAPAVPPAAPAPAAAPTAVAPNFGALGGVPAVPAAPAVPPAPPAAPAGPAGPQMTAKAAGVPYESFIAQGWTDDALRRDGYIV